MIKLNFKKLYPEAVEPYKGSKDAACYDLTATSYEYDYENDCHIYGTGLVFEIPIGYQVKIYPRSSNRKKDAYLPNHVGIIDSDYRGEIFVSFKNRDKEGIISKLLNFLGFETSKKRTPYMIGERIAQMEIVPTFDIDFVQVEEVSKTERGEGGHGSTGK